MSDYDKMLIEDIIDEVVGADEDSEILRDLGNASSSNSIEAAATSEKKVKDITDTDVLETITEMINKASDDASSPQDELHKQLLKAKNANETDILSTASSILNVAGNKNKSTQLLKTDVKKKVIDGVAETVGTITTTLSKIKPLDKAASLVAKKVPKKIVSTNTQRLKLLKPKKHGTEDSNAKKPILLNRKGSGENHSNMQGVDVVFDENPNTKTKTIIHMQCDKCGLAGQFEDRIQEFGCPQCDGMMRPTAKSNLNSEELKNEIKVSHQEVVDYQEKVKLATAVVDNIFSNTSQRLSQLETASRVLKKRVTDSLNNDNRVTIKLADPVKKSASRVLKKKDEQKENNYNGIESHSITKLIPAKKGNNINVDETLVDNSENAEIKEVMTDSNHRFNDLVKDKDRSKLTQQITVDSENSTDSRKINKYGKRKTTTTLFEKNKIKSLSLDDEARKRLLSPINFQYEAKDNRGFFLKVVVFLLLLLLSLLLLYYFLNRVL
ncbi:hypothetical protein AAEX28_08235 [Lentisphaerota bacterium WC36G]|nr:hypothetical protein LJT99_11090 [Lentisphaerae bacterium WC36]